MHRDKVRLEIARQQCPRILLWSGGLLLILSFLTWLEDPSKPLILHVLDVLVAAALVLCGLVIINTSVPDSRVPWIFAAASTVLVLVFAYEISIDKDAIGFAYLLIVLTAVGPSTLSWPAFLSGAAAMLVIVSGLALTGAVGDAAEWILVSLAALAVGSVLLRFRITGIHALADAQRRAHDLATTDELTGLMNRHGLESHLDRTTAMARRLEQPMFAMFVDIDGLKAANDRHGHAFGDEVIEAAAHAVLMTVRAGDLVVRWGGDEIVVVGIGEHPDSDTFARRLDENVAGIGIDRDKWPGHLSVGYADGDPVAVTVDDLIEQADFDMYGRRKAR